MVSHALRVRRGLGGAAAALSLLVAACGGGSSRAEGAGEVVLVLTEARHDPGGLADRLASRLGATRQAAGDHVELVGPKGKVVIAGNPAAVERDVGSGALAPQRMVVYFASGQGGMSVQHKATLKSLASKKIPVVACAMDRAQIEDEELLDLQKTECKDALEEAGYGVGGLQQIVVDGPKGTNLDQLAAAVRPK
jgi:hypothetical protein